MLIKMKNLILKNADYWIVQSDLTLIECRFGIISNLRLWIDDILRLCLGAYKDYDYCNFQLHNFLHEKSS